MQEIWKDVKGYEGLYQVSNLGHVKSLRVRTLSDSGKYYTRQERLLKIVTRKDHYQFVILCNCGITKMCTIHRLVAQAFIPNPNNLPFINHKDENPSNNHVDNLEWCTHVYNMNYGNCKKKQSAKSKIYHNLPEVKQNQSNRMKNCRANDKVWNKRVLMYDLNELLLNEFDTVTIAANTLNLNRIGIYHCCNGISKTSGGYIWKYEQI